MLDSLTSAQKIAICSIILGALGGSAAQFTPIFGATIATDVATLAAFFNTIVGGIIFVVTGQKAQVQNVAAMPGVDGVSINKNANSTLAAVAMDPAQQKVMANSAETRSVLIETAKGA